MDLYQKENPSPQELDLLSSISDQVDWAHDNNRKDIIQMVDNAGTLSTEGELQLLNNNLRNLKLNKINMAGSSSAPNVGHGQVTTSPSETLGSDPMISEPVVGNSASSMPPSSGGEPVIPEPTISDPRPSLAGSASEEPLGGNPKASGTASPPPPSGGGQSNESSGSAKKEEEIPPSVKGKSSEDMVAILLDAYCDKVPKACIWYCQISPEEMFEWHVSGKVDLSQKVMVTEPTLHETTIAEHLNSINGEIRDTFVINPEWKASMKYHLTEIAKEKGVGVSHGQAIAMLALEHVLETSVQIIAIKSSIKELIKAVTKKEEDKPSSHDRDNGSNTTNEDPPPSPAPPSGSGNVRDGEVIHYKNPEVVT